jgi:spermidine synthase
MLSHCHADPARMLALKDGTYTEHACSSDTPTIYKLTTVAFAGRTDVCSDVVIADNPTYGRVLFLEGELQSAETDQVIYHEMLVHPVMAATTTIPDRKVLVVGGGEGATVQEVLRWTDVSTVVWIDIDQGLVNLCRRHLDWTENDVYNNPKVQFLAEDIRTALPRYDKFDVIILDLPDPDSEEVAKDGQVIAITHLPQIAQYADTLVIVHKDIQADNEVSRTESKVRQVTGKMIIKEVKSMAQLVQ